MSDVSKKDFDKIKEAIQLIESAKSKIKEIDNPSISLHVGYTIQYLEASLTFLTLKSLEDVVEMEF